MAVGSRNGQTLKRDVDRAKYEEARRPKNRDDDESEMTPEEQEKYKILRYCAKTLSNCQKARRPHETFDIAWSLFNGDVWSERRAPWRASITINKIRAFITFIQAIMTDNKPRFTVEPWVNGTEDAADLLHRLVDRDWDENDMQDVISLFTLYGLIWGYAFVKVWYDPFADNGRGKHMACAIPPYRIYANKTATDVTNRKIDALIHIEKMSLAWVRENFPKKANLVAKHLRGVTSQDRNYQYRDRDYINEGNGPPTRITSAMNVDGNIVSPQAPMSHPEYLDDDGEEVEIQEFWLRDTTLEKYQRQVVENGKGKFAPVIENGEYVMQVVGTKTIISEIDGTPTVVPVRAPKMEPVMEDAWRLKFPNGRLVVIAAGRVLLRDIPNPFQTDGFPFAMWKDYDIGGFYGQGEPLPLRSCAIAINKLASQVFEILEKVGNPSWIMKKGAGVNSQSIKNKPGLIIPMDDIEGLKQLEKAQIPAEFFTLFKLVSEGMAEVSGVNEAVKGALPAANTAFATMDQLQESGSAPIRLKVRNLEKGIARIGRLRIQLIQQFDQGQRPLRVTNDKPAPGVVEPVNQARVEFRKYTNADLRGQVEFNVIPISSLSTSPAGTWNRWMTMLDKRLIDQKWWHDKFRIEGYRTEFPRMMKQQALDAKMEAAAKDKSKPGPAPSRPARQAHRAKSPTASQVPSRQDNAAVR